MSEFNVQLFMDAEGNNKMYPHTKTSIVFDDNGNTLDEILAAMAEAIENMGTTQIPANKITQINFDYNPTVCLSTADQGATQYDNYQFSFISVLKVSDSMYHLYYTSFGTGDNTSSSSYKHLMFAYSTDGTTWVRGFPANYDAPNNEGIIFEQSVFEHHVFKVQDSRYPYRLICNYGVGTRDRIRLYKSADAVNFIFVRDILMGNYDSQLSAVDKGGMVKVYLRLRTATQSSQTGNRQIGYFYMDYDGNLIAPPTLAFDAESLYNAAAMPLDDHRDILFPTHYDADADAQDLRCYIIDSNSVKQVQVNTSKIISSSYQTFYVSPMGIVQIGNDQYIFYMARTTQHDTAGGASYILQAKIKYNTIGVPLNVSA